MTDFSKMNVIKKELSKNKVPIKSYFDLKLQKSFPKTRIFYQNIHIFLYTLFQIFSIHRIVDLIPLFRMQKELGRLRLPFKSYSSHKLGPKLFIIN